MSCFFLPFRDDFAAFTADGLTETKEEVAADVPMPQEVLWCEHPPPKGKGAVFHRDEKCELLRGFNVIERVSAEQVTSRSMRPCALCSCQEC